MRPEEPITQEESRTPKRYPKLEFFYFEQVGSRYVLRLTWLTVILIIGITVISLAMIFAFFLVSNQGQRDSLKNVNVNVSVPSSTPYSQAPIIKQAPAANPPQITKQPKRIIPDNRMPTPSSSPLPNRNTNKPLVPKPTPHLQPSESPP
jgi:hypothetical protein